MFVFVRSIDGYADVIRLLRREAGQLCSELFEVETCHLFVKFLVDEIDSDGTPGVVLYVDLRQHLIGEAAGHDKRGVSGGTSEVDQTTLCKQIYAVSVRESVTRNRALLQDFYLAYHL